MGWRDWLPNPAAASNGHRSIETALVAAGDPVVTAAAQIARTGQGINNAALVPTPDSWQDEVWGYYDTQGEFGFAVTWKASMISRVRLRAGKLSPGSDEPELADEGPAADLVNGLFGGPGGRSNAMSTLAVHLNVPGESWMVVESRNGHMKESIRSAEEVRTRGARTEVIDNEQSGGTKDNWRPLEGNDWMLVWVHRPHKRKFYMADSPARRARAIIRELELVNRHITAQYLSRLASAGIIILPEEITFPVRDEFQDEPDPFVAEWIEVAREAIAEPGTASSVVPIPMRMSSEMIDKVQHIDFTVKIDEKIIDKRESAIRRLALQVDIPAEILLGTGDVNHWTSWQLEESAVKAHILPDVELICGALTEGWLHPLLKTQGVDDVDNWVVWYDASEITLRPDRSTSAFQLFDRGQLTGEALRRETGMAETDAPSDEELTHIILTALAFQPQTGLEALARLFGDVPEAAAPGAPGEGGEREGEEEPGIDERRGPPQTREDEPPPPDEGMAVLKPSWGAWHATQGRETHWIDVRPDGAWLRHPLVCDSKRQSCPYTHALARGMPTLPGQYGLYRCALKSGSVVVGGREFPGQGRMVQPDESDALALIGASGDPGV